MTSFLKIAFQPEKSCTLLHDVAVVATEMAFAHAQVIHRIQQIGFAHAIQPGDEVQPGHEIKSLGFVIAEMGQYDFF
jgi:hypothetical protein